MLRDLWPRFSSVRFWRSVLIAAALCAVTAAVVVLALSTLLVLVPLAIVGRILLHLQLRRRTRHTARHARPLVIDGEYVVISR